MLQHSISSFRSLLIVPEGEMLLTFQPFDRSGF